MAADAMATVRDCSSCARTGVRLREHLNRFKLFPAVHPIQSRTLHVVGILPRPEQCKQFILAITNRFTKLAKAADLRKVMTRTAATAFCKTKVFNYGPQETLLSNNGTQLASGLFQNICQLVV